MNTSTSSLLSICNGEKTTVLLHPPEHWSFHVCLVFRNWICHNSSYILKLKQWISFLCSVIAKRIFSFDLLKAKISFLYFNILRIHTGFHNLSKTTIYDLHLKKTNPFDIGAPCINITRSKVLFEQYRMALNWDKYVIAVRNDDAIKRNRILFDFMKWTFNRLAGLYIHENVLWWIQ